MATKDVTDLQVCLAYRQRSLGRDEFPYGILSEQTGECQKVCYCAMERAHRRGLIECGVSLRTGWLTDKGRELIAQSEKCNEP